MFYIYADGKSIYEPLDDELTIHSPKIALEMGKAGALQFSVPPSHRFYSRFEQLAPEITVELDDNEIFRGRVLTNRRGSNNMRRICCEGDLAYLVDSVQRIERFHGTTHELFRRFIARHNARVDASKQFTVGEISVEDREIVLSGKTENEALDTDQFDYEQIVLDAIVDNWPKSLDAIQTCLIDTCGGYLRTRRENGINYIDWLSDYGNTAIQEIEFGVNLLDLTQEVSAEDVFNVLIPLGDENLTIESVNGGSDELVNEAAVERYRGRIVRTHVFDGVSQPETLMENARLYMEKHGGDPITITAKAVDLHLVNKDIREIRLGDRVRVNSLPHGLVDILVCTRIEYDLENPANNTYTFGTPKQSLTERYRKDRTQAAADSTAKSGRSGGAGAKAAEEEAQKTLDKFFDAWINVDKNAANINLGAVYKELKDGKAVLESTCGISLDAPSGNVNIKTVRKELDENINRTKEQRAYIDLVNNERKAEIDIVAANTKQLAELESNHHAEMLVFVDELQAKIDLNASHIEKQAGQLAEANAGISLLAEDLKSQVELEASHHRQLDGKITNSNARIEELADDLKAQIMLEAQHRSELGQSIAALNVRADNLGSSIEAKADKITLNSKVATINSDILKINGRIEKIEADVAEVEELIARKISAYFTDTVVLRAGSMNVMANIVVGGMVKASRVNAGGEMTLGGKSVATQEWVNGRGFLTELPGTIRVSTLSATENMFYKGWTVATEKWVREYVTGLLSGYARADHAHSYDSLTGKPSSFPPAAHRHRFSGSATLGWGHTHTTSSSFKAGKNTGGVANYSSKSISISGTTETN